MLDCRTHFGCLLIGFRHKGTTSADDFWQRVKPTALGNDKPQWMNFDDAWVDEVARGVKACKVFLWYPLYCEITLVHWLNRANTEQGLRTTKWSTT